MFPVIKIIGGKGNIDHKWSHITCGFPYERSQGPIVGTGMGLFYEDE